MDPSSLVGPTMYLKAFKKQAFGGVGIIMSVVFFEFCKVFFLLRIRLIYAFFSFDLFGTGVSDAASCFRT